MNEICKYKFLSIYQILEDEKSIFLSIFFTDII